MNRFKRLKKSFNYAFNGLKYNIETQPNFRIHMVCALLALIFAFLLDFSLTEWAIVIVIIFLVFTAEAINTAIEATVDCATKENDINAMRAKDSAAAAVMLISICALIIGALLYLRKILILFWR